VDHNSNKKTLATKSERSVVGDIHVNKVKRFCHVTRLR